jgi:hypothetical protein
MGTIGAASVTARASGAFTVMLGFVGMVFPCLAFAWDGLVRRRALIAPFPVGATLGGNAALLKHVWAVVLALFALLLGGFFLLAAWGFYLVALQRQCPGRASLACVGALAASATWVGWAWFGLCAGWFVIVWLRIGDPRKRVLVPGVWYQQDRAAEFANRQLRARGLAPLSPRRLYAMEAGLVRWLTWHQRLGPGAVPRGQGRPPGSPPAGPAPSGPSEAREVPGVAAADEVLAAIERERDYLAASEAERTAMKALIPYFLDLARRGERQSPLARWWVRTGQLARLGIYGRRTL